MTLIHELNDQGQHRIVQVEDNGTNTAGEWADVRSLAEHGKLLANADMSNKLPSGIFTVAGKAHQVLA